MVIEDAGATNKFSEMLLEKSKVIEILLNI